MVSPRMAGSPALMIAVPEPMVTESPFTGIWSDAQLMASNQSPIVPASQTSVAMLPHESLAPKLEHRPSHIGDVKRF
jgi:hypothetical protein